MKVDMLLSKETKLKQTKLLVIYKYSNKLASNGNVVQLSVLT